MADPKGTTEQKLTLDDVARRAGTSASTVSRVLSGRVPVSSATADRVMAVVRELGYVPNAAARSLARRRAPATGLVHHAIALVMPEKNFRRHALWEEIYDGILEAADDFELTVTILSLRQDEIESQAPPSKLRRANVDGLLLSRLPHWESGPPERVVPRLLVGGAPERGQPTGCVQPNNRLGMTEIVDHLYGLGHRRFEFVTGGLTHLPFIERAEIFLARTALLGLEHRVTELYAKPEVKWAAEWKSRPVAERATAIVASHDGCAMRLINGLRACHIRVPEEVSVVGFDGRADHGELMSDLSTWQVKWHEMGRVAVKVLMDLIEGETADTHTLIGGRLLDRGSTASPPQASTTEIRAGKEGQA